LAKKKPLADDPRFDEFLQKQFAELKRELAKYPAPGAAKQGKILQLTQAPQARAGKGSWKYGIAAAVLVAVAVPMVIQLNQQKAEFASRTEAPAPATDLDRTIPKTLPKASEKQAKQKAELDSLDARRTTMADQDEAEKAGYVKGSAVKNKKKVRTDQAEDLIAGERNTPALKAISEEAMPKDAMATGKAEEGRVASAVRENESEKFFAKKEEAKPLAQNSRSQRIEAPSGGTPAAPAVPPVVAAPAPAARPAITRSTAPSTEISGGDRGTAMAQAEEAAPAEKNARSIAVDDAKTRFKKQDAREDEKAEMEKLWKEFEKDPQSFNQDKKRSARLRTLLSRHNEKSRAKRMRSAEAAK
jgi:hypothetical protein